MIRRQGPAPTVGSLLALLVALFGVLVPVAAHAHKTDSGSDQDRPLPSFQDKTRELEPLSGFLDLWLDRQRGRVWLELPAVGAEEMEIWGDPGVLLRFLWIESLATGFGSNPVGLDRGQLGDTRVARFRRLGGKVLFEVENTGFRASSEQPQERRAVEESFADSVLWAGEIAAQGPGPDTAGSDGDSVSSERILVDLTPFLLLDHHQVGRRLQRQGEGTWTIDESRSAVDPSAVLVFPDNVEIDALLSYGEEPAGRGTGNGAANGAGANVRGITPVDGHFALRQHHSFVRLPPPGFTPRPFDSRMGSYDVKFQDYAAPLDAPLERRFAVRFRLEKTDPTGDRSPVQKPIVFHVDPGTPEPVRSALIEGASWWAEAFEKAGFEDAYRVALLPEDAHPLDVRYNVIQWVHRSTRGWSYGGGVIDPRTGQILKGHVNLGSLRVRQDRRIFEALLGVEKTGTGAPDDPLELALARIRQLAAHEVGHALGFAHNFAASTYGRASVMDYPAPWIRLRNDGTLDVSEAYGVGMGAWDLLATRWAYSQFPPGTDEEEALEAIVREGIERGLRFVADEDARPPSSAHPLGALWDNGADPVAELGNVMAVRRAALARFGEGNIAPGRPLALLQELLAPLYLYHRYQVEAVIHGIGGLEFRYAVRGDGQPPSRPVGEAEQREALDAVLATLEPEELDLPEEVLALLLPRPSEHVRNREMFPGATDPVFDPLAAAASAADHVVRLLLEPHRAARLVDFHRRNPRLPGLSEVISALETKVFTQAPDETPRRAEIRRTVETVVVAALIDLAANREATPAVRTRVEAALEDLRERLPVPRRGRPPHSDPGSVHRARLTTEIGRWLDREGPADRGPSDPPAAPPGSPIGAGSFGSAPLGSAPIFGGCSTSP